MNNNVENKTRICEFCSNIIDYKIAKRILPKTNRVMHSIPDTIKWKCECKGEKEFISNLPVGIKSNPILILQQFNHNKFKNEKS